MKKSTFFLLITLFTVAMLFAACNKNAEIICQNCAAAVTGGSQFCPNCGTAFLQNSTGETTQATADSTESTAAESTAPPAETEGGTEAAPTPKPTTPPAQAPSSNDHAHSFSAATCTKPQTCSCGVTNGSPLGHSYAVKVTPASCTTHGYTTYTCVCGDSYRDNYTIGSHKYRNYICASCGSVDKAYAYEYLIVWTIANGIPNGTYSEVEDQDFTIYYNTSKQHLAIEFSFTSDNQDFYSSVFLDDYYFFTSFDNNKVDGFLNAATFTSNSPLPYTSYSGDESVKQDIVELSRLSLCDILDWLEWFLAEYDIGISIADLGFTAY